MEKGDSPLQHSTTIKNNLTVSNPSFKICLSMHTTDTKKRIFEYIKTHGDATNRQLRELTGITIVGISKHLKEMVDKGQIVKSGIHPRHTYLLSPQVIKDLELKADEETQARLQELSEKLNADPRFIEQKKEFESTFIKEAFAAIRSGSEFPEGQREEIIKAICKEHNIAYEPQ